MEKLNERKITQNFSLSIFLLAVISLLIGSASVIYYDNKRVSDYVVDDRYSLSKCVEENRISEFIEDGTLRYCIEQTRWQANIDDFRIRRHSYLQQHFSETVMLIMIVLITFSGVALSGLQLYGSFKLAKTAEEISKDSSELSIETGKISLRSSIVGILILLISFAFFSVFVYEVYKLEEAKTEPLSNTRSENNRRSTGPFIGGGVGAPPNKQQSNGGVGSKSPTSID